MVEVNFLSKHYPPMAYWGESISLRKHDPIYGSDQGHTNCLVGTPHFAHAQPELNTRAWNGILNYIF